MPSLSDRLKAMGVKVGSQDLAPPKSTQIYSIDRVLDGRIYQTLLGETYAVEGRYPSDYAQGAISLTLQHPLDGIADWVQDNRLRAISQNEIAFLDTETTGLAGGTGTYAFLIGIGRFVGNEFYLAQFFMRDPIEEPGQLAALEEFLAPCIALVTFNGKAFDVPLLATRYMLQGWQPPFREQVHIDLLHLARRLWRLRLPSRTLPTLEFNILKSMRTEQDIPGWMIPQIYFDYLRSGDARPLKNVFYHNAMDVLSLAALLNLTAGLLADPLHAQVEHGLDLVALGRLYEDQGNLDLTEQLYLQSLQSELPDEVHLDTLARLAYLYKRQDRLDEAVSLWEKAAQRKHLESHIELAKFYEHRLQRYDKAIFWTQQALEFVDEPGFTTYERNYWINELEHRLHRLQRLQRKSHD